MPAAPGAVYRFDRFVLDLRRGVLMEQGVERQLRPKTFTLLEYFVQNAGRVVGRDEIMEAIWPDVIVTDDSIAQCIREIRRTLADDSHQLVRTLPRRGYQFVGPVDICNPAQTVASSPPAAATDTTLEQVSRATTAADAPVLPDKPSIAVLPFANLSADPNQSYFSDGVTHDVITELSRFSELLVIASNSSFQYRDRFPDMRQVGRELGVRYGLGGSIRRSGSRVRITAELVDTATRAHLWAERYDREVEDVFAVQDDVVRTIVTILAARVRKAEFERTRTKPPGSLQAYDYYLQAAAIYANFLSSFSVDGLYQTRRLLDQALAIDPGYGLCCALMAETYVSAFINPLDGDLVNRAVLDTALQFARRAVQLDPNSPMAHSNLGHVLIWRREHEESIAAFEKAVALNPNDVNWRFAYALVYAGHPERAIKAVEDYMRRDPFHPPPASLVLGLAHCMLKRYAEALPLVLESVRRAPKFRPARAWLAVTYVQLGQIEEARAEVRAILQLQPNYTISGTLRPLMPFKRAKDNKLFFDAMRKAGVPD
jgi:TolB-like protein/Tfp pilus assembly protein PilF